MEQDWSPEVVLALEALAQLPTAWYVSSIGFDIAPAEGQPARLFRSDDQYHVELGRSKTTLPLREVFDGCDVAVVVVNGYKRVHGYDARIDSYREIGPNPSGSYSDEQKALIKRDLKSPRTGDSEKLARVKGIIESLPQGDRAVLRLWMHGQFEADGSKHVDSSEGKP